jgi:hypothetical protein
MASRSHTSYKKRQKELARMEKQRDKAERRLQRKADPDKRPGEGPEIADAAEVADITGMVPPGPAENSAQM